MLSSQLQYSDWAVFQNNFLHHIFVLHKDGMQKPSESIVAGTFLNGLAAHQKDQIEEENEGKLKKMKEQGQN